MVTVLAVEWITSPVPERYPPEIRRYRLIIIDEVGYIRLIYWSQARRVCGPTVLRALAG